MKAFRRIVSRSSIRSALFVMTFGAAPCAWGWSGDFASGNDLMEHCKNKDEFFLGVCIGYLEGVEAAQAQLTYWQKEKPIFCAPAGTTRDQRRQVFLNYMTAHPQDWHILAAVLVLDAFRNAWPCSQ